MDTRSLHTLVTRDKKSGHIGCSIVAEKDLADRKMAVPERDCDIIGSFPFCPKDPGDGEMVIFEHFVKLLDIEEYLQLDIELTVRGMVEVALEQGYRAGKGIVRLEQ